MKINDPFHHPFNEREATQIACRIVAAYGKEINFYRLVKLLYIVEREFWTQLEQPAMGGAYFSMKDGPMISETSDAAKPANAAKFPIWAAHLKQTPYEDGRGNKITLLKDAGRDDISDALLEITDRVIATTKSWNNRILKAHCHSFKEYKEPPPGRTVPIQAGAILMAEGKSPTEIEKLQAESNLWKGVDAVLA